LTAAAGFDLGYHGYLVSDSTAAFSSRIQENTEELVSTHIAAVTTADQFLEELAQQPSVTRGPA
jgi:nicotinamidase-related amidase